MAERTLLLRADAAVSMGAGHLMRSLSLAEAWQRERGQVVLLSHCPFPDLQRRIRQGGMQWIALDHPESDPAQLAAAIRSAFGPLLESNTAARPWVALDGYQFDFPCQQAVRETGCRLLVIDDFAHAGRYDADLLVDQNLQADRLEYPHVEGTTLLLGSRYVLLRSEFHAWQSWQRSVPPRACRVLVTLGGSDPGNATALVIEALASPTVADLEARVVVGPGNPHLPALRQAAAAATNRIELLTAVADMAETMAWADVAVSAAGSTCWELAFMQLPALLLPIAENQRPVARALQAAGVAENIGPTRMDLPLPEGEGIRGAATPQDIAAALSRLCDDQPRRANYAAAGRRLIDGGGADRVVAVMRAMEDSLPANQVRLRRVAAADSMALWRLANEPSVRESSLSTYPISLDEHEQWFQDRIDSPRIRMWVLEFQGLIVATIRYLRLDSETAEISLAVAPAFRHRGLATRLLLESRTQACRDLQVRHLQAVIREENRFSLQAFRKAGFEHVETQMVHGTPCHIFMQRDR
jgi:UDP-2,4-diacetamido-2,4,6-trideoxy-beta-L-altropyranose hydrolase